MERSGIIILIVLISAAIVAVVLILLSIAPGFSPNVSAQLVDCKLLEYNGDDKVNVVYFSTENIAKEYTDFLLSVEPYNSTKKAFNFFYIDDYIPTCEIYQGVAILCYSKELIKRASSCPADLIVVPKSESANIRSSTYMNVMALNTKHSKTVFIHEIGHALANLADEYLPSKIPRKSQNCQKSCDVFEKENVECFQGCSTTEHFRSIENGVMRTLSTNEYGKFNENLILEKLKTETGLKLTGLAIKNVVNCSAQQYILVSGKYNNEKIDVSEKTVQTGCFGGNGAGGFAYKLNKVDGSQTPEDDFNPELIFTEAAKNEAGDIDGEALEYGREFHLKIPKIKNAQSLEITKEGELISTINLQDIGSRPCRII